MLEYLDFKEQDQKKYRCRVRENKKTLWNFDPYPYHLESLEARTDSPTWSFVSEFSEDWIPF